MIKMKNGYAYTVSRSDSRIEFRLVKLFLGFIPPLFPTYHKETGFITVYMYNETIKDRAYVEKALWSCFNDFLIKKDSYDKISKILK